MSALHSDPLGNKFHAQSPRTGKAGQEKRSCRKRMTFWPVTVARLGATKPNLDQDKGSESSEFPLSPLSASKTLEPRGLDDDLVLVTPDLVPKQAEYAVGLNSQRGQTAPSSTLGRVRIRGLVSTRSASRPEPGPLIGTRSDEEDSSALF
jgi:hypothetical protein